MYAQCPFCSPSQSHCRIAGVFTIKWGPPAIVTVGSVLHLEAYTRLEPEVSRAAELERKGRARVTHVVIRLDTRWWTLDGTHSLGDFLTFADISIAQLPFLRTATLETTDENETLELADKLPQLSGSGRLRRRTCEEALKTAEEASRYPAGHLQDQGVVSPFWISRSDLSKDNSRKKWCANVL